MKKLNFDIFTRYGIIFTICFAFTITLLMISTPVVFAQEDAPGIEGPAVEDRGPPEGVGKPEDAGPSDDVGPETKGPAVEDRGPPEGVGKPEDAGPSDDVGPETKGPAVEDRGPPEGVGKPEDAGAKGQGKPFEFGGTLPETLSPLKQMKMGVAPEKVNCKTGMELILKPSGDSACVKSNRITKLLEIGWLTVK